MSELINPIGYRPYEDTLKTFFTMKLYPDMDNQNIFETIIPVTGPPVLNLGSQQNLNIEDLDEDDPRKNQIIRLPASSLTMLDWTFDITRWTRAHFRKLGWSEDGNRVVQSPQLVPIDVIYQLDLWSKYRSQMNQMLRNVLVKFAGREVWLEVDLKGVWGKKTIPISMLYKGPVNMTEHEPKDKDRTIRMVYSFLLRAWIIPDATMIPTVKKVLVDLYYTDNTGAKYPELTDLPPYPDWIPIGNSTDLLNNTLPTELNP